ncbi:MAG: hypothetical protein IR153_02730 [Flavobacterium sp.]|nr:hypothetical protein [Flavobacterium sp.]MBF0693957.1 hypothetical protein [Flavobacterium sp.]
MKIKILMFFFFLSTTTKADTITTWKVFYNNKLLKSFVQDDNPKNIHLKVSEYQEGDYLAIQYADDTRYHDCSYELKIVAEGKLEVITMEILDKYKLMKIDLKDIINNHKSNPSHNFFVVYFTEILIRGKRNSGPRLFNIRID